MLSRFSFALISRMERMCWLTIDLSAGLTCSKFLKINSAIVSTCARPAAPFLEALYLCTNPQPLSAHYRGGQKSEPLARLKGCANFSLLRQVMQREMHQVAC